jgi:Domain of unknown function (DUF6265)
MKAGWIAVLGVLLGAVPARAQGPLQELAFMTGCWRGAVSDSATIEETWTAADGDVMLATTRYLQGGRVVGWEFSRIQADSAGIALTPYPDGEPAPAFRMRSEAPGRVVFSNPENDFPADIIYSGDGKSALTVRLEGSGRQVEWRMLPGACGTPVPAPR